MKDNYIYNSSIKHNPIYNSSIKNNPIYNANYNSNMKDNSSLQNTVEIKQQAQRRAAMDRRMHCIIPNESYNINHNVNIRHWPLQF